MHNFHRLTKANAIIAERGIAVRIVVKMLSMFVGIVLMYKWRYLLLDVALRVPIIRKMAVKRALNRYMSPVDG